MDHCAREGAELRIVPRPTDAQKPGRAWNERILDAIDADTAVVTLTAVHWTDGTRFDLEPIGRRTREVGGLFVVDGTQSIGALPFDFAAVKPDLLVCAGYKWLLGPYQYGFAVVGERLIAGRPFEMNWINREHSEDFAHLVDYRTGYQPGARRFDAGEHSNFIMVPMLNESLRLIQEWGVENIQDYCAGLGRALSEALGETAGFTVNPPEERGAHLFGVRVPHPEVIPAILEQLSLRKVFVSQRGDSVRVSPNVYNTPGDMAALAEALHAALK
jgi:selenocysteine lyase/cysteine desulfurase